MYKKIIVLFLLIFTVSISSFASSGNNKILIAYFSRFGNTDFDRNIDATAAASIIMNGNERIGTTGRMAEIIQSNVGGDIHLIKSAKSYPTDFDDVVVQARKERNSDYISELANKVTNMDDYEIIFIGYPVWGTTIPAPVQSFLSEYNFSGKKIIPFCTHDGYGSGVSFREVRRLVSGAEVLEGIAVETKDVRNAQNRVNQWLKSLGITKSEESSIPRNVTPININIGSRKLSGYLNNSSTAQEFIKRLPQKISMVGFGGREYYGGIDEEIKTSEQGKLNFEDGDITYCPANNTIAIFYAQTSRPNLSMRVISIGKVTEDLSIFNNLGRYIEITFESVK